MVQVIFEQGSKIKYKYLTSSENLIFIIQITDKNNKNTELLGDRGNIKNGHNNKSTYSDKILKQRSLKIWKNCVVQHLHRHI